MTLSEIVIIILTATNLPTTKDTMGQESKTYLAARILNDGRLVSSASVIVFQLTFLSLTLQGFLSIFE